ncbi:MAG: hypothetical protein CMD49_03665 [Gammaproteobacteria bacterium]|nr:hypothetical protein [Gammaproteobacteria bacterium]
MNNNITVKIIYLSEKSNFSESFTINKNMTIKIFFEQIKLKKILPSFSKTNNKVGIYGRLVSYDYILNDQDRIEIYDSIKTDPKLMRKKIALTKNKNKLP